MKPIVITSLVFLTTVSSVNLDKISPTAAVCIVAGVMKAQDTVVVEKYKRKDCPVCKGKGWYISGDGIAKVECGYCEPDDGQAEATEEPKDDCCKTEIVNE